MSHTYTIGASGYGKSTLMAQHIIETILDGGGCFVLDPHGDLIDTVLEYIPPHRRTHVLLFDPSQYCIGFNVLENVTDRALMAETILYALRDIWRFSDKSTPTFDDYVFHSLLALMEGHGTLLGLRFMLTSEKYRSTILTTVKDKFVKDFWATYETLSKRDQRTETSSTRNKANILSSDLRIRRTIGQAQSSFQMSDIFKDTIFLCRLPQGALGIQKTRLLGMLLLAQLHMAALGRTDRSPFDVFIDEVHHFQGYSLMEMLSGVRKFGVSLHIAHQYLEQLTVPIQRAIIGNITERYIFNIGRRDTEEFRRDLGGMSLKPYDLPRYTYLFGKDFCKVEPLPPSPYPNTYHKTVQASRERYSRSCEKVDKEIDRLWDHI